MNRKTLKSLVAGTALSTVIFGQGLVTSANTQTIPFTITVQESGKGFTINDNGASNIKMIQDTESTFNLQGREVGKYRNASKIGVTITNDQNGGADGEVFAKLTSSTNKLSKVNGKTPNAGEVSVFTSDVSGGEVELNTDSSVSLGVLAGDATKDFDFDIYLPADVIDQTDKDGVTGFKSETYNFIVTYTMK